MASRVVEDWVFCEKRTVGLEVKLWSIVNELVREKLSVSNTLRIMV